MLTVINHIMSGHLGSVSLCTQMECGVNTHTSRHDYCLENQKSLRQNLSDNMKCINDLKRNTSHLKMRKEFTYFAITPSPTQIGGGVTIWSCFVASDYLDNFLQPVKLSLQRVADSGGP